MNNKELKFVPHYCKPDIHSSVVALVDRDTVLADSKSVTNTTAIVPNVVKKVQKISYTSQANQVSTRTGGSRNERYGNTSGSS